MMDNSGPAFPNPSLANEGYSPSYDERGMSLRDWLAGQALSGIITATARGEHDPAGKHGVGVVLAIAKDAYEMADAMLEARK